MRDRKKKAKTRKRERDRQKENVPVTVEKELCRSSAVSQTLVQGKKFGRCFHFPVSLDSFRFGCTWAETDVSKKEGKLKPKASASGATGWSHHPAGRDRSSDPVQE